MPSDSKQANIFLTIVTFSYFKHLRCHLCSVMNKICVYNICKALHFVLFFTFYTMTVKKIVILSTVANSNKKKKKTQAKCTVAEMLKAAY